MSATATAVRTSTRRGLGSVGRLIITALAIVILLVSAFVVGRATVHRASGSGVVTPPGAQVVDGNLAKLCHIAGPC